MQRFSRHSQLHKSMGEKSLCEEQFFTIGVASLRNMCFEGRRKERKRSSDIEESCCTGNKAIVASPVGSYEKQLQLP